MGIRNDKINWRRRLAIALNDLGTLALWAGFAVALFAPLVFMWFVGDNDVLGVAALLLYGWFAVSAFKGIVGGRWR